METMCRFRCWNRGRAGRRPDGSGPIVRDDRPAGSGAPSAVWFAYSPDRKGEHPLNHLKNYSGVLQADGFAGFNRLYETGRIREAACWAHARRKFFELHQGHGSPLAKEALERIAQLYAIEKEIRGRSPAERKEVRQARSRPLLEALQEWLKVTMSKLSRKSELAKAIHYALERWDALMVFVDDGRIRWTTMPRNGRCGRLRCDGRTICSRAPIPA